MSRQTSRIVAMGTTLITSVLALYLILSTLFSDRLPRLDIMIIGAVLLIGSVLLGYAFLYHEKLITGKINTLNQQILQIGKVSRPLARLISPEKDDLAVVVQSINQVLDEFQQTERVHRENEERYRTVLEQAREGFALVDSKTLEVLECNTAFQHLLDLPEIIPPRFSLNQLSIIPGQSKISLSDSMLKGDRFNGEYILRHTDNIEVILDVSASLILLNNSPVFYTIVRDITIQKQAQLDSQRRLSETLLLNRVIAAGASVLREPEVLQTFCREIALGLQVPNAIIALIREKPHELGVAAQYSPEHLPSFLHTSLSLEEDLSIHWQVIQGRVPVAVEDVIHDPRISSLRNIIEQLGIQSLLIVPLALRDQVFGTLTLGATDQHIFSPDEINLVQNLALAASQGMENARLYTEEQQELSERKRAEEALIASQNRYRAVVDSVTEVIYQIESSGVCSFLNAAWEEITQYSLEESLNRPFIDFIHPEDQKEYQQTLDSILSGEKIASERELRINTRSGEIRWMQMIARARYEETERIVAISGTLTDITDQKQAENALRRSEETIRTLYNITSSQQLTFSEKVQALLVMGCQHFDLRTGLLSKVTDERYEIQACFAPERQFTRGMIINLDHTFCKNTLRTGGPVGIDHAGISEWANHLCYQRYKTESYLGTPVIASGKIYGTLNFSSQFPHPAPFSTADKEFLRLMAQWIGSQIEQEQNTQQLQRYASEINKKNSALADARDQALEASRLKSEFLSTMSHEIRTPMNAVIGMTELLLETPLQTEQKEFTTVIRDSGQVLLSLINDILDFSKIEAGKLSLESIDFSPVEIIEGAADLFTTQIHEKGLALMTYVDPRIPLQLRGDPTRLRQVIVNLVGNAVKFTEEGEIVIRAELLSETEAEIKIHFEVMDSGIGLSAISKRRLFQPFTQADGSTTRKYGGTGLGLAISKRLVEAMGGEIDVKSEEGIGSTFWFTARFERCKVPAMEGFSVLPDEVENLHVLIVDDNATHREILTRYLSSWGMRSGIAASGEQALIQLRAGILAGDPYRLAIMDLCMPGMDGFTLAQQISQDPDLQSTRTILLTAYDERGQLEQAMQYGCSAYIVKPIKLSRLFDTIVKAVTQKPGDPAIFAPADASIPPSNVGQNPHIDALILLAEDNAANQKLATIQIKKLGYRVEAVQNGQQVVEAILKTNQKFSVILMDCQMPEVDGFSATRIIRKAELTTGKHIPIVAMTANAMQGDRETCLSVGMDDYISKPIRLEQLREILYRWIHTPEEVPSPPVPSDLEQDLQENAPLDQEILDGIRMLQIVGEPDFLTELIDMYLQDSAALLEKIKYDLINEDCTDLRRSAHSLKGSSSNLGARGLAAICQEMESLAQTSCLDTSQGILERLDHEYSRVWQSLLQERKSKPEVI